MGVAMSVRDSGKHFSKILMSKENWDLDISKSRGSADSYFYHFLFYGSQQNALTKLRDHAWFLNFANWLWCFGQPLPLLGLVRNEVLEIFHFHGSLHNNKHSTFEKLRQNWRKNFVANQFRTLTYVRNVRKNFPYEIF